MSADTLLARIHQLTHDSECLRQLYKEKTDAVALEKQENDKLEKEKIRLQQHLKVLMNKADDVDKCFMDVERKLRETEVMAAESERLKHTLQLRGEENENVLETLESQLSQQQAHTAQAEKKHADIANELKAKEEAICQAEKQAENLERKLQEIEKEVYVATNKLRLKKARTDKEATKDEEYKKKINELVNKIKEALDRADASERKSLKQQKQISILADELSLYNEKADVLRKTMDTMLVDVQDA